MFFTPQTLEALELWTATTKKGLKLVLSMRDSSPPPLSKAIEMVLTSTGLPLRNLRVCVHSSLLFCVMLRHELR